MYRYIPVDCEYVRETAAAVLLISEFGEEVWVPKSLIDSADITDSYEPGDTITIGVADWFAEKNGLV